MSELGIFHHPTLSDTKAAFRAACPDGPNHALWLPKFSASTHGDFTRWEAALAQLPDLARRTSSMNFDLGAVVGPTQVDVELSTIEHQLLLDGLRQLLPWRKGPFQFFDHRIDTEWRSDWKWTRLAPHLPDITEHRILDIGSGNGYFGWRLIEQGAASVLGVDPTLLFCMQHLAVNRYAQSDQNWVVPLTFEDLPPAQFDGVMSLGVIYHRRDPAEHVQRLFEFTRPGGWVALETLVVDGTENLVPSNRYARMRNVWCVPAQSQLLTWLEGAGFAQASIVDVETTSLFEQRRTAWMTFESLAEATDGGQTIEGHPAPRRAIAIARRPT